MSIKRNYTDQVGRSVVIKKFPERIVSLVPSQTELLYHLGLGGRVVGITKFCIHPEEWYRSKTRIGGPKKLKIDKIKALQPDLIIGNKEENIKEEIETLQAVAPVWLSDIYTLNDNYQMITSLSDICDTVEKGKEIIKETQQNFASLSRLKNPVNIIYLIWKKPLMAVASNTFIHHILTEQLGFINSIGDQERYPVLDEDHLPEVDYVFLSTEPYPFSEKHFKEIQPLFPHAKLKVVDGEYFTWYGSRLINAPQYFEKIIKEIIS